MTNIFTIILIFLIASMNYNNMKNDLFDLSLVEIYVLNIHVCNLIFSILSNNRCGREFI